MTLRWARRKQLGAAALVVVSLLSLVMLQSIRSAPSADAATVTLTPVADTTVNASAPTTTAGSASQLTVDGSPVNQVFVRFDLGTVTGTVQSARLRLHVDTANNAGSPAGGVVATTSNTTWPEATTNWNTRPAIDGAMLATMGAVTRRAWVETNVTAVAVAGTVVSFAVSSTNADAAIYDSRETGSTAPQLILTTAASVTTTSTTTTTTTVPPTTTTTTAPPPPPDNALLSVADTYVAADTPTTNYGASNQVIVDGSPVREMLLRFDLSALSGPVQSAKLRLHAANVSNAGSPAGGAVSLVNDNAWVEGAVTYDTRPTAWGTGLAAYGAVTLNTWAELDVTAAVTTGAPLTLGLRSTNTDGAYYDSRESGANAPQLVVTLGTPPPPVTGVVVAAAGDAVCAPGGAVTATTCRQLTVSNLIVNDPSIESFLALGDLQYENGELANFQAAYDPSYGRVKAKTKPAPGNHEYNTAGAPGYYGYFGAAAGDPTKGYSSFDVGDAWHLIALNSNCSAVACAAGSPQEQWLEADLLASTRPCTIAYWHHPRFSSSSSHGNDTTVSAFWDALQQDGAEVVLNGHAHVFERFAPQLPNATADPNGIRQIVVGTGGKSMDGFAATPVANSSVRMSGFGILKLTLGNGVYSWQFVNEAGNVLDSGTGSCH